MFTYKLITASMVLAIFTAAPGVGAAAQAGGQHDPAALFLGPPPDPESIDTNADGKISREEMHAARATEFASIDTDDSGELSLSELQVWNIAKISARFQSLDNDGSGSLSSEEFKAGQSGRHATMASNLFKLTDLNSDGQLAYDEFSAVAGDATKVSFYFAAMDADGDGKVSVEEFAAPPPRQNERRKRDRADAD